MNTAFDLGEINKAFLQYGCQHKALSHLIRGEEGPSLASHPPSDAPLKEEAELARTIAAMDARIEHLRIRAQRANKPRKWVRLWKAETRLLEQIKNSNKRKARRPFSIYKSKVWKLTELQPLSLLDGIEKRAWKGWHVDHVLSIAEGFRLGLPPETIAHISNLRMLPAKENMDKGTKTVYTNLFNES